MMISFKVSLYTRKNKFPNIYTLQILSKLCAIYPTIPSMTCLPSCNVNLARHFIDILHNDIEGFVKEQCWGAVVGRADDNCLEAEQGNTGNG